MDRPPRPPRACHATRDEAVKGVAALVPRLLLARQPERNESFAHPPLQLRWCAVLIRLYGCKREAAPCQERRARKRLGLGAVILAVAPHAPPVQLAQTFGDKITGQGIATLGKALIEERCSRSKVGDGVRPGGGGQALRVEVVQPPHHHRRP